VGVVVAVVEVPLLVPGGMNSCNHTTVVVVEVEDDDTVDDDIDVAVDPSSDYDHVHRSVPSVNDDSRPSNV